MPASLLGSQVPSVPCPTLPVVGVSTDELNEIVEVE